MRLWSLHPQYLDAKGLVAVWREGLLARAVLIGKTKGYTHHPQLIRFQNHPRPVASIDSYLHEVCDEAARRGYHFDRTKLGRRTQVRQISVKAGQLEYEFLHLKRKLQLRDPSWYLKIRRSGKMSTHPLFRITRGGVELWEKT